MIINDHHIYIPEYSAENIEGELVIFSQSSKKIIVFNKTASLLWCFIKDLYEANLNSDEKDIELTTESLCEHLTILYNIPERKKIEVYRDVQEIIERFFLEGLLVKA